MIPHDASVRAQVTMPRQSRRALGVNAEFDNFGLHFPVCRSFEDLNG
jgi:hypothetical protein